MQMQMQMQFQERNELTLYPCTTKTREVLGNPSLTPERFSETLFLHLRISAPGGVILMGLEKTQRNCLMTIAHNFKKKNPFKKHDH